MTEARDVRRPGVVAPARTVRTVLPAGAAVLLATGAHLAGGGAAPTAPVLLGCVALATALAHRLSARRWTARTLVALLVLLQGVVHLACAVPSAGHASHGAMTAAEMAAGTEGGTGMLLWHAVATVLTGLVLLHGERVLWAAMEVLDAGVARLAPVPVGPLPALRRRAAPTATGPAVARPRPLVTSCALRGPPAGA